MAAYLDTNVFDHLYKKIGCTSEDIASLRKQVYGRQLSIPLSIHTLEEILLDRRARPELLVAKIKLTLSIANFRRTVKPCDQLLTDDIRAYAATGEAARPFIDAGLQNIISEGLATLIESDGEDVDEDLVAALEETRRRKERFLAGMEAVLEENAELPEGAAEPIGFAQYFDHMAPAVARSLAQRAGVLDECAEWGIDGLLQLRSVRGCICTMLAWADPAGAEKRANTVVIVHAMSAAAVAETLVTDDPQAREILTRAAIGALEVIDLPGFLQKLQIARA